MSLIAYPNALKYREQATDPWSTATIFAKADLESLADKFDTTETYTEGEIVLYQGGMYKCKAGGAGPGAWDSTEWDQTTVEAELAALQTEIDSARNTLNQLDDDKAEKTDLTNISQDGSTCDIAAGIPAGTFFYRNGVLKRALVLIQQNESFTDQNTETVTDGGLNSLIVKNIGSATGTVALNLPNDWSVVFLSVYRSQYYVYSFAIVKSTLATANENYYRSGLDSANNCTILISNSSVRIQNVTAAGSDSTAASIINATYI